MISLVQRCRVSSRLMGAERIARPHHRRDSGMMGTPFSFLPVLILLLVVSVIAPAAEAGGTCTVSVAELRCEYLENPLGIDTPHPRFSWKLFDRAKTRGQKQTSYRIVVEGGSPEGTGTRTVLWDSGKVDSPQSVNNVYSGAPLTSGRNCFWKVRIWDKGGTASIWSPEARFSIGLLEPSDWKGEWIRFKEADNIKHIWYRKNFALQDVPSLAFVYLASIGYHELYVNGRRIGTRVLSPAVSNLEKRALYVTYDITGALRDGDNVIAVWTGPGWARADGSYGKGVWKQDSIFKCQIDMSNGVRLHSDTSWRCRVSSSENLGLWKGGGQGEYGGELIDARRHVPDWNQASFDDSDWAQASNYAKSLILSAEMLEPDRKVETLRPVSMAAEDGLYTFDMGRNFTGWLEFDLREGKAGDLVKFTTSNQAGKTLEFKQESHYIHDAGGTGTFRHRFNYMAGRWITVEGLPCKPSLDDLRCYLITNDRKRTGRFECSNPLFNQIYETDLRTYIANTVNGVTMDCPHRERFGYGEIALACSWGCGIPQYESAAFYRKATRDWFDVQREDGFVNTIAPQVYKGAGGTLWSSAPVTLTWEFYRAYGDKRQLDEAYGPMKKWLDYLHEYVSDGGVLTAYEKASRFLGDWATPHGCEYGNTPEAELFNNCVYAYCLEVFVQAARELGRTEDAKHYAERLAHLRTHAHTHFYDEDSKTYIDGRQLAMAFPLYTGITPEREREAVFAGFVNEIANNKLYMDTGSSGLPILLKYIVEDAERADLLYPCLTRTEQPGYGYFFTQGETTWPEYWKIVGHDSRIHTCYTGIAGYFTRGIGGIRPDPSAHGMQRFIVKPNVVGDLTYANTTSGSMYGMIVSKWTRSGSSATFDVEIPVNTTAKVHIPAQKISDVLVDGEAASRAEGIADIESDGACVVLSVDSGRYRFSSAYVQPATLAGVTRRSEIPDDCPFERSQALTGVVFTGRHSDYRCGDTFYPSWASDGNLYSPWTDGVTDGVRCGSGGSLANGFRTGHAVMSGDDPLKLVIKNTSPPKRALAAPYRGRYPCGSLVHDGIWYYGTYCLGPSAKLVHHGFEWNWPNLGPMPGFHISRDQGKTWQAPPTSPEKPLFPEPAEYMGPVKMGAPHFVDFGKNMEHSPDGKAYLLGMGAELNDPKPRPCIKPGPKGTAYEINENCEPSVHLQLRPGEAADKGLKGLYERAFKQVEGKAFSHANLSWITADQVYLARVTPSPETINRLDAYEFFAGHDAAGKPIWTGDFTRIKPLLEWNNHMGCVTATYVPGLNKYLMCVTDGWPTVAKMDSYILEADTLTGPWRMVSYMKDFGEQAYFLNFPSKFISDDGRTLWLCYSANFSSGWNGVDLSFNPPGGRYGLCLHEIRLLGPEGRRRERSP